MEEKYYKMGALKGLEFIHNYFKDSEIRWIIETKTLTSKKYFKYKKVNKFLAHCNIQNTKLTKY